MKLTAQPTFVTDTGRRLAFVPLANAPGFSHRVIIDRVQVDWLGATFKPNAKAARFFLDKHPFPGASTDKGSVT